MLPAFACACFLATGHAADSPADVRPGGGELASLLSLLDEQTDLATKSRLNADYVPGMVTVLSGDELLARGARSVWQALALVPGISQGMEFTGERQILSRGVGHGYASGNVKILLDGVSMNSTLLATANPVLNMPIEQVARIEVIRGPGTSMHGEYAYAGVVNVITRRGERSLHAQADGDAAFGGGGVWNWRDEQRDLSVSLNLAGLKGDGPDVQVDRDAFYETGMPSFSNAPGPSNESHDYRGLFLNLNWSEYFASVQWLDDAYGDHFGINHFLPPADHRLASRQRYQTFTLGRDIVLSDTLRGQVRLEAMEHHRIRDQLYVYPGGFFTDDSIYMDLDYRERRYQGTVDLHWQPQRDHELLLGLELRRVDIERATWTWPEMPFDLPETWIDPTRDREVVSLVVQDQYRLSDRVTLTATLRYDDYSDVGSHISPRLAAVWRIDQENILKLQFAEALRPPTFYELEYAGTGHIESSEIRTFELGYILKKPLWEARLSLFRSDLTDPIAFDELNFGGYVNEDDARLQGVELEYQRRLGGHFKLDGNLSYVDATSTETGQRLPGGAAWLGNLGLMWQPRSDWSAALQARFVGERSRAALDPREPLGSDLVLDLTIGYRPAPRGPKLWAGIKNLTDEDVRLPDQLTTDFEGQYYLPYPDDYPRPGRRWWVSLGYDF